MFWFIPVRLCLYFRYVLISYLHDPLGSPEMHTDISYLCTDTYYLIVISYESVNL